MPSPLQVPKWDRATGRGDGRRDHAEGYETESNVLTQMYQDLIVQPETRA